MDPDPGGPKKILHLRIRIRNKLKHPVNYDLSTLPDYIENLSKVVEVVQ
jgi:hypothetical protein